MAVPTYDPHKQVQKMIHGKEIQACCRKHVQGLRDPVALL